MGGGAGLMAMRRLRSQHLRSGTTNARTMGRGSVTRPALGQNAAGKNEIAPGAIHPRHMGSQVVQEPNIAPELIYRESIEFDQPGSLALSASNDYPCRYGGRPLVIVTLKTALTTAGELKFYKNGTLFATETLAISDTFQTFGPWPSDISVDPTPVIFRTDDRARLEISAIGAGGVGFHASWRFS